MAKGDQSTPERKRKQFIELLEQQVSDKQTLHRLIALAEESFDPANPGELEPARRPGAPYEQGDDLGENDDNGDGNGDGDKELDILPPRSRRQAMTVGLTVPEKSIFAEELGWMAIRHSSAQDNFECLNKYVARMLCYGQGWPNPCANAEGMCWQEGRPEKIDPLSFYGVEAYKVVKEAIKCFEMDRVGVACSFDKVIDMARSGAAVEDVDPCCVTLNLTEEIRRLGRPVDTRQLQQLWNGYLQEILFLTPSGPIDEKSGEIIAAKTFGEEQEFTVAKALAPRYLAHVKKTNLPEVRIRESGAKAPTELIDSVPCYSILREKLQCPPYVELIWSYWCEEGMLVQALNAISLRFQNKVAPGNRDPLTHLDLDPLRPLSNLFWGYIQDEQNRLTISRRNFEYDHQYGVRLVGKAAGSLRSVDSRSKFIEAFHFLLYRVAAYYREEDDATVAADPYPLLNALTEVHLLLAHGAHNQFGDLPWTARVEMRTQQWLLGRPEMREFLAGKPMVPYREPWMNRIDTLKKIQGWSDVSISHYFNLALWGEMLLLSVRYTSWSQVSLSELAGNWATYFRPEIQGYIHAYRAVTGVDLTADPVDARMPSAHLADQESSRRRKSG